MPSNDARRTDLASPQCIYSKRKFLGIALDPPDLRPGSWIGAGKAVYDGLSREYLLTARPRKAEGRARGYAANIYGSQDGVTFDLISSIGKEQVSQWSRIKIHSIEGTQLVRNPENGRWHLFLSADTGDEFVWGGIQWETLLITADSLKGPWAYEGTVLRNDRDYDAQQARDGTIDIIDGKWLCLYKAKDSSRRERPALATSQDGIHFDKLGALKVNGLPQLAFLSGTLFETQGGPLFMGIETQLADSRQRRRNVVYADEHGIGHGGGSAPHFVAYLLRLGQMNLERVFRTPWVPLSAYEHREHPLLGYSSLLHDPVGNRILTYVEAIDPNLSRAMGLNETVERVLLYESISDDE